MDGLLAPESACAGQTSTSLPDAAQIQVMICMHRYARVQRGLADVRPSKQLHASAQRKARDVRNCQQLSHEACGRDAFYWVRRVGFMRGTYGAGEILALGDQGSATVRGTMSNWLNFDQHRSILLDPRFDEIGLGLVHGGFRGYAGVSFWVGHFGYHG